MDRDIVDIDDDQKLALENAIEFYIRLGLGQFSEIALRLDAMHGHRIDPDRMERIRELCDEMEKLAWGDGKPWDLKDKDVSIYTLNAFLLEAQMRGRRKEADWTRRRIGKLKDA